MEQVDRIFKTIEGEKFTPLALARKLGAKVILESASLAQGRARYSILMVKEAFRVVQKAEKLVLINSSGHERRISGNARDILDVLPYFASQHKEFDQEIPLPAGGVGFLSFEFAQYCDTMIFRDKPDELDLPLAAFLFGHIYVVFDHYTDHIHLIGLNYKERSIDLEAAVQDIENRIHDLDFNYMAKEKKDYFIERLSGEDEDLYYTANVGEMRKEIIKGNLLQGVPSRRLKVKTDIPALEAYSRLRAANPSPYLFYLDMGEYQLFGSSPEVHVKVQHGRVQIKPIAGTRRRGATRSEDLALENDLLADEKEKAEHLMLVDLARNDIGRVCNLGTVEVKKFMDIERFSHVMHIVSTVEGDLAADKTAGDAIRATFPAGTVSGAPKIKAIEVIDRLEQNKRGFYAGLVGYFDAHGGMDTCITIRSAYKKQDLLVMQAGGGIVFDSNPERELEETNEKIRALATAVGLEV